MPSVAVVVLLPKRLPFDQTSMFARAAPPAPVTLPVMRGFLGSVTLMPVRAAVVTTREEALVASRVNPVVVQKPEP